MANVPADEVIRRLAIRLADEIVQRIIAEIVSDTTAQEGGDE